MSKLKKIIDNNYCIGCGACAIHNPNISIKRNKYGLNTAHYALDSELTEKDDFVCPFTSPLNENILGNQFFSSIKDIQHDSKIGYYNGLYAGKINNDKIRINTSSGGLISWLLTYLLDNNLIDGVIHVKATENEPDLFSYDISHTSEEILSRGKSRYYNISFNNIQSFLTSEKFQGRYVFIGVPCYVKALRLLCEEIPTLKQQILYFFALFCGHMKTSAFAELLSWQQGIAPHELQSIDFRVKNKDGQSSRYSVMAENSRHMKSIEKNYRLYGSDWGLGFFKPKACDWCDDISGELADITFGDAWLPEYTDDPLGTNIVIVRNQLLNDILTNENKNNSIALDNLSKERIIESQAGNYRHRHEGLSVRISNARKNQTWYPQKRISEKDYKVSASREKLYLIREQLALKSHENFLSAKKHSSLFLFALKMLPLELQYAYYNKRLIKGSIKAFLNLITINFKKGKQL